MTDDLAGQGPPPEVVADQLAGMLAEANNRLAYERATAAVHLAKLRSVVEDLRGARTENEALTRQLAEAQTRIGDLERPLPVVASADPPPGRAGRAHRDVSPVDGGQRDLGRQKAGRA